MGDRDVNPGTKDVQGPDLLLTAERMKCLLLTPLTGVERPFLLLEYGGSGLRRVGVGGVFVGRNPTGPCDH